MKDFGQPNQNAFGPEDRDLNAIDPTNQTATAPKFLTGTGTKDSHALLKRDGTPNTHPMAGQPYGGITDLEIVAMIRNPVECDKDEAPWFIPSTYREFDGRSHLVQRERGTYYALVLDIDKGAVQLPRLVDALDRATGKARVLVYATKSATAEAPRRRVIIPVSHTIAGADYPDTVAALCAMVADASGGDVIGDASSERAGQVNFLPNRGAFYDFHIGDGEKFSTDPDSPFIRLREERRRQQREADEAVKREREARQAKRAAERAQMAFADDVSPVDEFNARHTVEALLDRYGYKRDGRSKDWQSRYQTSGSYATRDCGDHWISLSGSDAAAGLGAQAAGGARWGDAFDLYCHYEHGGNFVAAVRAYGAELRLERRYPSDSPFEGFAFDLSEFDVIDEAQEGRDEADSEAETATGPEGAQGAAERPAGAMPVDPVDLSHDALALGLNGHGWADNARHVATWGKWLFWNRGLWEPDDKLRHLTLIRGYLRARARWVEEWAEGKAKDADEKEAAQLRRWARDRATLIRQNATVTAVANLARSNGALVAGADDFDADPWVIGTPGGTVDLRTGLLRPAQRSDLITRQTSVAPAPGLPSRWLAFLSEIFEGDEDMIAFMQRAAGYALTGDTSEHRLLFCYGGGRNGKSVYLNTLFDLMGDYARRAPASLFLNSTTETHPTDVAGLRGARLVVGSELPRGKTWDEAKIKDLTGGDKLTARVMRGDYFDFMPQFTLFVAGNTMPSFRGIDEAIRSRVILIPFDVRIPDERQDRNLPAKLRKEGPQILQWAIEGALEWQRQGLNPPVRIKAASAEYFEAEDVLGQFLDAETEPVAGHFVSHDDLYQRFNQWGQMQGLHSWTARTLAKEMKARGYADAKGTSGKRGLRGVRLR